MRRSDGAIFGAVFVFALLMRCAEQEFWCSRAVSLLFERVQGLIDNQAAAGSLIEFSAVSLPRKDIQRRLHIEGAFCSFNRRVATECAMHSILVVVTPTIRFPHLA